jgi:hypothetical protein
LYEPAIAQYKGFFDGGNAPLLNEHQTPSNDLLHQIFTNYLHQSSIISADVQVTDSNILVSNGAMDMLKNVLTKLALCHRRAVGKNVILFYLRPIMLLF